MKNPWEDIKLSDYEEHMKLASVIQLQSMNIMMEKQFNQNPIKNVMVLGIAGGNGLEHIDTEKIKKVYGVDINKEYLEKCKMRYQNLNGVLECICTDLTAKNITLPHTDMVIANLLVEYIGYQSFQNVILKTKPTYVSCIIQINTDEGFVSDSPYLHVFDKLNRVHHQMQEDALTNAMYYIKYCLIGKIEQPLPNGKKLIQLDYRN